jgi:acyl-CoA thioester hydrolase
MWYAGKFDEANWSLLARLGLTPSYLREFGRGMAAIRQSLSYKRELHAGDVVEVQSRLLEVGEKSIRFEHEMLNAETDEIVATCDISGLHVDRQTRKSTPFAPAIRHAAMRHLAPAEDVVAAATPGNPGELNMDSEVNYRGAVYPWQCDHVGHMNVMWYVGKFDEANWNFLARLGLTSSYVRESGHGLAAVQQNLFYKREMRPGDLVEIKSRLLEVRDKTLRFLHEMRDVETDELAAACEMTAAHLNRETRRAAPWPAEVRHAARQALTPSKR